MSLVMGNDKSAWRLKYRDLAFIRVAVANRVSRYESQFVAETALDQ